MKFDLKNFQEVAARDIITKLDKARESVAVNDLEAIILAAPTGSGIHGTSLHSVVGLSKLAHWLKYEPLPSDVTAWIIWPARQHKQAFPKTGRT